ncbi:MAG TPA: LytTR family DNA-binding domain-containing protein [Gemmatimonadales bacterium]|nr:LytTR family DNA-binding domain-containing protein [Gemmatimonadales bacterium]
MTAVRTVIADDEAPARQRIAALLARERSHQVVAQCASGPETLDAVRRERPDLLFLDVQMPGMSGLQVLQSLEAEARPVVVFTTAYDEYALHAFDQQAVDYLLKPFTDQRFAEALGRARRVLQGEEALAWRARVQAVLDGWPKGSAGTAAPLALDRFAVKRADAITIVPASTVDWIEAARDYVKLHAGREVYLIRATMTALETRLDPREFIRIHRSTVVRVDRIRELQPFFHGDYVVVLKDGTKLRMSRSYRPAVQRRLGLEE